MSPTTIYLISGANRGLGLALVANIVGASEDAFVYAGARDPQTASALKTLKDQHPTRIEIVKCVSGDKEGNIALAAGIEVRHGRVDTVIANAGIADISASVADVSVDVLEEHFHVNVAGTVILFQALYPLLKKSTHPRFVSMSSPAGRLNGGLVQMPQGGASYGASKAALNWVTRKIHFENEWLVAFPMSPGPVATDILNDTIKADTSGVLKERYAGMEVPSAETVATALIGIINKSTRETEGGEFVHVDGTRLPW